MKLTALYVAVNEEARIAESIRSVRAYVDQIVVVDCVFIGNPNPATHSSDRQREVATWAAADTPLIYAVPNKRMPEHEARNLGWSYVDIGDWAIILDADEVLYGDHATIGPILRNPPGPLALKVYTTAVMFPGTALDMDEESYARNPLINTWARQTKVVQHVLGLHTRKVVTPHGNTTYDDLYIGRKYLEGAPIDEPFVINHHVRASHAAYQNTYLWETAQGGRG